MTGDDEAIAMNVDEAASLRRLVERLGRLDVEPPKDWAEKERRGEWATIVGLIGGVAGLLWLGWPLSAQQVVIGAVVVLLGVRALAVVRNQDKQAKCSSAISDRLRAPHHSRICKLRGPRSC